MEIARDDYVQKLDNVRVNGLVKIGSFGGVKKLLAKEGLTWREERNPRAITLETHVFAYVFRDRLELPLNGILVNDGILQNAKKIGQTFGEIPKATFLSRAKNCITEIVSHVANVATVVGTVDQLI